MKKRILIMASSMMLSTSLFASQYTIKNGDSLSTIAKKYNTTISELKSTNNLKNRTVLKVGKIIDIPSNKTEIAKDEQKSYIIDESKFSSVPNSVQQKLGKKYVWGAVGPNCFDCSGLTTYAYKQQGVTLPRTANAQSRTGQSIDKDSLLPGDLVFFATSRNKAKGVNHVGIYVGNNSFIHASSAKHQVVETSLDSAFYKQTYRGAKRVKA
jgi:cell wall-associated NlpC family hydrolase